MTSTEIATREASSELVEWVRSDEARHQLAAVLPSDVMFERFEQATITALLAKPELANAERASLYLAILAAAQAGLVPDNKQGAIVTYRTKVKQGNAEVWIEKAQFLPMIGGIRDTLAQFGWSLRTALVYEHDEFAFDQANAVVTHVPVRVGLDRGQLQGAYAKATHRGGRVEAEVMTKAEIDKVRAKSSRGGKVWEDWYERMAEKTVGHRLAKKIPLDQKDRQRVDLATGEILEQGAAAGALYGPPRTPSFGELPSGHHPYIDVSSATPEEDGGPVSTAAGTPEEPPAAPVPPAPAAGGSPDDDFGDEPVPATEADEALAAAQEAAGYVVNLTAKDNWANGMTLAQIRADERHPLFFRWALTRATGSVKQAATAYAKVQLPELFAEIAA